MKSADVVVIGGSAAGLPAAITARRHYPDKSVMIVRKEEQVQIPCGIPYIFGTVEGTQNNLIPDGVLEKNGIQLLVDEAVEIDREGKVLRTAEGEEVGYERLVLAMGARPARIPIPGLDKENVFTIEKDVPNLERLLDAVDRAENLVVLGGGFIGVEFADECRKGRDLDVTIVEMLPHCLMLAFEDELCAEAEAALKERGINVRTGAKVAEIVGEDKITGVRFESGEMIPADVLIVGIGVSPNSELAERAGLETDRGGIIVDSTMKTSDDSIYACGDCTSKWSFFTGRPSKLKLASIASMESRIAGANLYGKRRENPGVVGVFSTAIGDKVFAMAGMREREAIDEGYEVAVGSAGGANRHPGGMPGMANMSVKLVFNRKSGEIVGGHVIGGPSAGELINTISACIQKRMTADDIATFQIGTHPAVTASPIAYQLVNAAEMALKDI